MITEEEDVYENLKSATVYTPKNFSELSNMKMLAPKAIFWGGGTYLMTRETNENLDNPREIISLDKIPELKEIFRTDNSIEVGAMVNLDNFAAACRPMFKDEVIQAIHSIGTQIIRKQATIGGALCTRTIKTNLSVILYCMEAQVEIRSLKRKKSFSRWIPISSLYDSNGKLTLSDDSIIVKIKIYTQKDKSYFFRNTGSPMLDSDTTTIFGISNLINQNNLLSTRIIFAYPQIGLHIPEETITQLANQFIPINPQRIQKLAQNLGTNIKKHFPNLSELQLEQSTRIFESYLYYLNRSFLELIQIHKRK